MKPINYITRLIQRNCILLFLIFCIPTIYSQSVTISGFVYSKNENGINNIRIEDASDSNNYVETNTNGNYSINIISKTGGIKINTKDTTYSSINFNYDEFEYPSFELNVVLDTIPKWMIAPSPSDVTVSEVNIKDDTEIIIVLNDNVQYLKMAKNNSDSLSFACKFYNVKNEDQNGKRSSIRHTNSNGILKKGEWDKENRRYNFKKGLNEGVIHFDRLFFRDLSVEMDFPSEIFVSASVGSTSKPLLTYDNSIKFSGEIKYLTEFTFKINP